MDKRYDQLPRFNAAGVTTGSILALIVAMAVSVVFDGQPAETPTGTKVAQNVSRHA